MGAVEEFERDGVAILRGLVPVSDLPTAADSGSGSSSPAPGDGRRLDAWRVSPAIRDLARHPAVLATVAELYGRRPIPFQTLNFERGTGQPLHTDAIHFDTVPGGQVCGVWVALEPVGDDQGPLRYVPGSQRLEPIEVRHARNPSGGFSYERYEQLVAERVAGLECREFLAEPGDALVWDGRVAHGGSPVLRPDSTRRSQVTHYFLDECVYVTPMHSQPENGLYRLRDPLVDIETGRWVRPGGYGPRRRVVRVAGGLARLVDDDEAVTVPAIVASRAREMVGLARYAAGDIARRLGRRPVP